MGNFRLRLYFTYLVTQLTNQSLTNQSSNWSLGPDKVFLFSKFWVGSLGGIWDHLGSKSKHFQTWTNYIPKWNSLSRKGIMQISEQKNFKSNPRWWSRLGCRARKMEENRVWKWEGVLKLDGGKNPNPGDLGFFGILAWGFFGRIGIPKKSHPKATSGYYI